MDAYDQQLKRLTQAVQELEKNIGTRENDIKSRQQDLFAAQKAAAPMPKPIAAANPPADLTKALDRVIDRLQTILADKAA